MMKQKRSIQEWAKEVVRCEMVLENPASDKLEIEQAQWKIESILNLYSSDPEKLMNLMDEIQNQLFKELTK